MKPYKKIFREGNVGDELDDRAKMLLKMRGPKDIDLWVRDLLHPIYDCSLIAKHEWGIDSNKFYDEVKKHILSNIKSW